ncbi:MAG: hypothetical protein JWN57_1442 [Frankiales bacterium]|jgi:hypothetical protein|nr:hypothetical protein [Frankiales bacterium]
MHPILKAALTGGLALAAAASLSGCGGTGVTRPRLESALAATFANLYVQQAGILGYSGVSVAQIAASAACDKGGPRVADAGPGADWICLVTFTDHKQGTHQGKFEVQAKSNACFVAGGPSKLVGLTTITDTHGNDVPNPVFEFDGCFDPRA